MRVWRRRRKVLPRHRSSRSRNRKVPPRRKIKNEAKATLCKYYTAKPLIMSNDFERKIKIESVYSKRTVKEVKVQINFKNGKRYVFMYYKSNRYLDFWELGRPHDTRLSHKRLGLDEVLSSVLGFIAENLSEIADITVEGDA